MSKNKALKLEKIDRFKKRFSYLLEENQAGESFEMEAAGVRKLHDLNVFVYAISEELFEALSENENSTSDLDMIQNNVQGLSSSEKICL